MTQGQTTYKAMPSIELLHLLNTEHLKPHPDGVKFGEILKVLRGKVGLGQTDLASLAGVGRHLIIRADNGVLPSRGYRERVVEAMTVIIRTAMGEQADEQERASDQLERLFLEQLLPSVTEILSDRGVEKKSLPYVLIRMAGILAAKGDQES